MAATLLSYPPAESIPGVSSGDWRSGGDFCCVAADEEIENPSDSQVPRKEAQWLVQAIQAVADFSSLPSS